MNIKSQVPAYDRQLLLGGAKRDAVLDLTEVHRYGMESWGDPDYVCIYGLRPSEWYARGIRILGNTLYWTLRHLPGARGLGLEQDPVVFQLTSRNLAILNLSIEVSNCDYRTVPSRSLTSSLVSLGRTRCFARFRSTRLSIPRRCRN
jgi:hypothetical protein